MMPCNHAPVGVEQSRPTVSGILREKPGPRRNGHDRATRVIVQRGLGRPQIEIENFWIELLQSYTPKELERGRDSCLPLLCAQSILAPGVHQLVHAVT